MLFSSRWNYFVTYSRIWSGGVTYTYLKYLIADTSRAATVCIYLPGRESGTYLHLVPYVVVLAVRNDDPCPVSRGALYLIGWNVVKWLIRWHRHSWKPRTEDLPVLNSSRPTREVNDFYASYSSRVGMRSLSIYPSHILLTSRTQIRAGFFLFFFKKIEITHP